MNKPIRLGLLMATVVLWCAPNAWAQHGVSDCLSETNPPRLVSDCPSVDARLEVSVTPSGIRFEVTNASASPWPGPTSVQSPYAGGSTNPSVVDRGNGLVVAQCTFETPLGASIAPGESIACELPRDTFGTGTHTVWLTGFRERIPAPEGVWGTKPANGGVAGIGSPRSVDLKRNGDVIDVIDASETGDNPKVNVIVNAEDQPADGLTSGEILALVAAPLVVVSATGVMVMRRRRDRGERGSAGRSSRRRAEPCGARGRAPRLRRCDSTKPTSA